MKKTPLALSAVLVMILMCLTASAPAVKSSCGQNIFALETITGLSGLEYTRATAAGDPSLVLDQSLFAAADYQNITREEAAQAVRSAVTFLDEWVIDGPFSIGGSVIEEDAVTESLKPMVTTSFLDSETPDGYWATMAAFPTRHFMGQWPPTGTLIERKTEVNTASLSSGAGQQKIALTGKLSYAHYGLDAEGTGQIIKRSVSFTIDMERSRTGYLVSAARYSTIF